jgi:hypothetical protein
VTATKRDAGLVLLLAQLLVGCSISDGDVLVHTPGPQDLALPPPLFDLSGDLGPLPSFCSFADVALCDGFEPTLNSPPWEPVQINATVSVDDTRAYRGSHSLHIHTNAGMQSQVTQGEITQTLAVPAPTAFVRAFVYIPSPAPSARWREFAYIQGAAPGNGPGLYIGDGKPIEQASSTVSSSTAIPLDRWVCMEWQVTQNTAGEMRLWLDEQEVSDAHFVGDDTTTPPAGRISVGMAFFGQPAIPAFDVWFDEVAIDAGRIGCER